MDINKWGYVIKRRPKKMEWHGTVKWLHPAMRLEIIQEMFWDLRRRQHLWARMYQAMGTTSEISSGRMAGEVDV
jgi:hypothetical protein